MWTTFKTEFYLDDVKFDVQIGYMPEEKGSWDHPGYPPDILCDSIEFAGVKFNAHQKREFIRMYGPKEFDEWMAEEVAEDIRNAQEYAAEIAYEQHQDRLREVR